MHVTCLSPWQLFFYIGLRHYHVTENERPAYTRLFISLLKNIYLSMCQFCTAYRCVSSARHIDVSVLHGISMCQFCTAYRCVSSAWHIDVSVLHGISMCQFCTAYRCVSSARHIFGLHTSSVFVLSRTKSKFCAQQLTN